MFWPHSLRIEAYVSDTGNPRLHLRLMLFQERGGDLSLDAKHQLFTLRAGLDMLGVNCAFGATKEILAGIAISGKASSTMRASAPIATFPADFVGQKQRHVDIREIEDGEDPSAC